MKRFGVPGKFLLLVLSAVWVREEPGATSGIFKGIFSSKGAHFAAHFARIFHLCPPLKYFLPPICPQKIQVLVPPLYFLNGTDTDTIKRFFRLTDLKS